MGKDNMLLKYLDYIGTFNVNVSMLLSLKFKYAISLIVTVRDYYPRCLKVFRKPFWSLASACKLDLGSAQECWQQSHHLMPAACGFTVYFTTPSPFQTSTCPHHLCCALPPRHSAAKLIHQLFIHSVRKSLRQRFNGFWAVPLHP